MLLVVLVSIASVLGLAAGAYFGAQFRRRVLSPARQPLTEEEWRELVARWAGDAAAFAIASGCLFLILL